MIRLEVKKAAEAKHISQRKLSMLSGVDIKNIQKIYRDPYRVVNTETLDMNVSIATVASDLGTTVTGIQTAITLYTLVMNPRTECGGLQQGSSSRCKPET